MASNSVVRGAINDMVKLSASNYQIHFHTSDNDWNNQADALLRMHDLVCDSRGVGYGMRTITEFIVKGPLVDGDVGLIKYFGGSSRNGVGYPMFQVVPSHRIASTSGVGSGVIYGGKYNGLTYIDGVIVNDWLRPVAYLVATTDRSAGADVVAIPANDMMLAYVPEYPDQVRGYSQLGASIFDWQDIQDTRRFDLIGRKARASRAMIVHNESGEADETQRVLSSDRSIEDDKLVAITKETLEGGTIEYFKASTGAKIESIPDDRPSTNGMEFDRTVARDALAGIGWSYDYAIDPTKAGGAQMRVVVEKVNRTILHLQRSLIDTYRRQLDNWRLAVFMARGDLPVSGEWMKYRYQVPAKLTADAKYQSQVDLTEYAAGFTTHERIAANRSSNWEDDQDQKAKEIKRAMETAASHGIPVEYLLSGVANTNVLTQSISAKGQEDDE
jgi:capsid protein